MIMIYANLDSLPTWMLRDLYSWYKSFKAETALESM